MTWVAIIAACVAAIPLAARGFAALRRAYEADQREQQAQHDAWVRDCIQQLRAMRQKDGAQ